MSYFKERYEDKEDIEFRKECELFREDILEIAKRVVDLKRECIDSNSPIIFEEKFMDKSEMIANLMLAYRHLEDARMRVGKAVQAYDGGKSVYPK